MGRSSRLVTKMNERLWDLQAKNKFSRMHTLLTLSLQNSTTPRRFETAKRKSLQLCNKMACCVENSAEKCTRNPEILGKILQQPMATEWEGSDYKPYALVELHSYSGEYQEVAELFDETADRYGMTISTISRIENPFLLGQYLMKKEKMVESYGYVEEKSLFHGTGFDKIDGICKYNFDWRRCGESRGHKFGQGVSFASEASYAYHYTTDNVMILAKVLVVNSTIGNIRTDVPPEGYDTTDNGKETVYVKYEDDDFYPQYMIHYY